MTPSNRRRVRPLALSALCLGWACVPGAPRASLVEGPGPASAVDTTPWAAPRVAPRVSPRAARPSVSAVPARGGWAERTLAGLTLRQKIGQMIMPFVLGDYAPKGSEGHDRIVELIEQHEVGGLIVSVGSPVDVALKLNDFQQHSALPLLVGADMEAGAGFRLRGAVHLPGNVPLGGATEFPPPMAVGATGDAALAYAMGRITAVESRAVGVHVPFAPVLDVNSNPDNPIINTRSFGESPTEVARLGTAFIEGLQAHGAIATAKHFPGHGDTETDSHLELPIIRSSRERLDSIELVPFRAAVEAGVGAVMTAHIAVPSLNGGAELPSTLSGAVLTDLLSDALGFDGLVFTDAMDMAAIDRRYPRGEATVLAVQAGADMVLMPPDIGEAVAALLAAVADGRLTETRIDASVLKILAAKEALALDRRRLVALDSISHYVGIPAHLEVADEIARRAVTLLRNERNLLPLLGTRSAQVLSVALRRPSDLRAGRDFDSVLRERYPRLDGVQVDAGTRPEAYADLLDTARGADLVIVSLYVNWTQASADEPLAPDMVAFVDALDEAGVPHVVVSFGNPYLLREVGSAQAYLLAWSGSEASQRAAAAALFGEVGMDGRTPIQLPPYFSIGDGLSPEPAAGGRR